jgi:hypothetical protein
VQSTNVGLRFVGVSRGFVAGFEDRFACAVKVWRDAARVTSCVRNCRSAMGAEARRQVIFPVPSALNLVSPFFPEGILSACPGTFSP